MEVRSKKYTYRATVRWTEQKKGVMGSAGKPDVPVATPPEFKGHDGIWSPEDLFVSAVNTCIMSTFLAFAERAGVAFSAYESEAEGQVELVDGKLQVTGVTVRPSVTVQAADAVDKAKEILAKAEANCLISNSIKSRVNLEPKVAAG